MTIKESQITNLKKWVEALRSGKYKQGKYRLKTNDYHCCLGVLCDVVDKKYLKTHAEDSLPSSELLNEAGLVTLDALRLAKMNDISEENFNEIADFIEETYISTMMVEDE